MPDIQDAGKQEDPDQAEGVLAGQPVLSEQGREAALEHLKFPHDRLAAGSDVVTQIGQYIFLLFGAGAVAATQVHEAFVVIPLFWSAWLLHSMQRTRDSIKHEVYARHLEDEINRSLGYPVLLWNYALTGGGGKIKTSPASRLNYFYWFALNASSWVMSVVILHKSPYDEWAYPVAGLGLIVYVGVIHWWATNKAFTEACVRAVEEEVARLKEEFARIDGQNLSARRMSDEEHAIFGR